jgi:hypothetical protein
MIESLYPLSVDINRNIMKLLHFLTFFNICQYSISVLKPEPAPHLVLAPALPN